MAPKLSIIVIFHNMQREAARTLRSLAAAYQQGVTAQDYEILAIDNGSTQPLDPDSVTALGDNIRYHFHATASISPVEAMNLGAEMARGAALAFIVDGARMATPGLVGASLRALDLAAAPFVCALSWHLGPDVQNRSMLKGYDQTVEDALLDTIAWPEDGYRLFEIATLAQSSAPGFLGGVPPECSWLALPRQMFAALGGFDTRFQSGGGGLINHDFRNQAMQQPDVQPIALLGEGVFHQFHGGVATNVKMADHPMKTFRAEYQAIRGMDYAPVPCPATLYYGTMPEEARRYIALPPSP